MCLIFHCDQLSERIRCPSRAERAINKTWTCFSDLFLKDAVFLNVSELSGQSQRFGQRLREAVEIALEQGDEDLLTVDVARLFLDRETEEMMDAFRRYCVRSGEASCLLSQLEKERELLRIFLRASQLENPALRRMDLHAFLMVPVQRITKYPLLLGRLLRATAQQDVEMRDALREAQAKVESYLTAINAVHCPLFFLFLL